MGKVRRDGENNQATARYPLSRRDKWTEVRGSWDVEAA